MMPALFTALATCAGVAKLGGKTFIKACHAAGQAAQMGGDSFDFTGYDKSSSGGSASAAKEPEHAKPAAGRMRTLLRLMWELFAAGVYSDEDSLCVSARPHCCCAARLDVHVSHASQPHATHIPPPCPLLATMCAGGGVGTIWVGWSGTGSRQAVERVPG